MHMLQPWLRNLCVAMLRDARFRGLLRICSCGASPTMDHALGRQGARDNLSGSLPRSRYGVAMAWWRWHDL